jgi:phage-related protein
MLYEMRRAPVEPARIAWEGNSRELMHDFPEKIRSEFGLALWALQLGKPPNCDSRPMQSVGGGVFELKLQDERTWYRTLYLSRIDDVIHVLHCFEKSSRKTPQNDLETARKRLAGIHARHRQEKK